MHNNQLFNQLFITEAWNPEYLEYLDTKIILKTPRIHIKLISAQMISLPLRPID